MCVCVSVSVCVHVSMCVSMRVCVCGTCLMTSVLSLQGVEEASLSWTSMVLAASVSPLLSLDELSITE